MEQALVEAMVACVAVTGTPTPRRARHNHAKIMRRFENVLENNIGRALYITELCAQAGVSHSVLGTCCREHLGMSPKRYLLLRRMNLVRSALKRADPAETTVTDIATNYGFWELGRFAVVYRSLFGEAPSSTLHRLADDRDMAGAVNSVRNT